MYTNKSESNLINVSQDCYYCKSKSCAKCLNNKKNIRIGLYDRVLFIKEKYPDLYIMYISLHGSQNYRMAGIGSDIDCYMIVLPNPLDIFKGKEISKTINYIDGSHITLKDLNTFIKEIKKGSFNTMEFIDPYIKPLFFDDNFIDMINYLKGKEKLINPTRLYASISGAAKSLTRNENQKSLSRLLWLCYFGENLYLRNMNYQDAISLSDKEQSKNVRKLRFIQEDELYYKEIKNELLRKFNELYDFDNGIIKVPDEDTEIISVINKQLDYYINKIYWDYLLKACQN